MDLRPNDEQLRDYLLGGASEDRMELLERAFMTDAEVSVRLDLAEEDLIEDYLDGALSIDDRHRFEQHFLLSAENRREMAIVKGIRLVGLAPREMEIASGRKKQSLPFRMSVAFASIAAGIAIVLLSISLAKIYKRNALMSEQVAKLQQDARLSSPANPATTASSLPPPVLVQTVVLRPGLSRGVEGSPTIFLRPGAEVLKVRLPLLGHGYGTYSVTLRNADDKVLWSQRNSSKSPEPSLELYVSTSLLESGDYRFVVSGELRDNKEQRLSSYDLKVVRH